MSNKNSRTFSSIFLALLLPVFILLSLNPIVADISATEDQIPRLLAVHPAINSQYAPPTTTVSITFDQMINPGTVSMRTFAVQAMQTGQLSPTYSVDNDHVEMIPWQPFKAGEIVHNTASTGILNLTGQGPLTPTVWIFRVKTSGGSGNFINTGQALDTGRANSVALGDLDKDGDLDAFVTNDFTDSDIFFNDGHGSFTKSGNQIGESKAKDVNLGDLDGDGDLDAFISRAYSGTDKILLNDGQGNFTPTAQDLSSPGSWRAAIGDIDGDGDLDMITAIENLSNPADRIWFNNGSGRFKAGQMLGDNPSSAVALGDLDNDGDLDAVIASYEGSGRVYFNDGGGLFTAPTLELGYQNASDLKLGDFDNDGHLDVLILSYDGYSQVWLNNGLGAFIEGQRWGTGVANSYYGFDIGDLDSDGDLDAFVADYSSDHPNEVWLNDGSAAFTKSNLHLNSPFNNHGVDVTLGDINNDGDLDAFFANDLTIFGQDGVTVAEVWLNASIRIYYPVYCINP